MCLNIAIFKNQPVIIEASNEYRKLKIIGRRAIAEYVQERLKEECDRRRYMEDVLNVAPNAICTVKTRTRQQGIGALYEMNLLDVPLYFFITSNQVLPSSSIDEVSSAILDFPSLPNMRYCKLPKDGLVHVWTAQFLDATIVELKPELAKSFISNNHARFLNVVVPRNQDLVRILCKFYYSIQLTCVYIFYQMLVICIKIHIIKI